MTRARDAGQPLAWEQTGAGLWQRQGKHVPV